MPWKYMNGFLFEIICCFVLGFVLTPFQDGFCKSKQLPKQDIQYLYMFSLLFEAKVEYSLFSKLLSFSKETTPLNSTQSYSLTLQLFILLVRGDHCV